jgi:hypothetical protein
VKREAGDEMVLSRRQSGEADACYADETRLLRNDLHVAKRAQHPDESFREAENRRIGAPEEVFQREVTARVPEIPGDQASAASRTDP